MCRICTYHYYFVILYLFTPQNYYFFPNSPNYSENFFSSSAKVEKIKPQRFSKRWGYLHIYKDHFK